MAVLLRSSRVARYGNLARSTRQIYIIRNYMANYSTLTSSKGGDIVQEMYLEQLKSCKQNVKLNATTTAAADTVPSALLNSFKTHEISNPPGASTLLNEVSKTLTSDLESYKLQTPDSPPPEPSEPHNSATALATPDDWFEEEPAENVAHSAGH